MKLQHMRHDTVSERDKLSQQRQEAEAAASEGELDTIKEQARACYVHTCVSFSEFSRHACAHA